MCTLIFTLFGWNITQKLGVFTFGSAMVALQRAFIAVLSLYIGMICLQILMMDYFPSALSFGLMDKHQVPAILARVRLNDLLPHGCSSKLRRLLRTAVKASRLAVRKSYTRVIKSL
ncbi:hypothetical protein AYI85_02940 [Shewanella algae]|nr:hypothetical protein AYI85_02940 [Shewanella algae]TVL06568.1 hypothetical protein AYI84_00615 [Shewanella algae]TVL49366.1 hypothetical protein AYI99_18645 [Shewanella algae]